MRRTAVNGRRISRKAGDRLIAARVAPPSQLTMYDPPTPKATCVFAPCRRLRHMYMRRSVRFARHVRRDARRTVSIPATVRHVVGGCQKSGVTNAVAVNVRHPTQKETPSTSQCCLRHKDAGHVAYSGQCNERRRNLHYAKQQQTTHTRHQGAPTHCQTHEGTTKKLSGARGDAALSSLSALGYTA